MPSKVPKTKSLLADLPEEAAWRVLRDVAVPTHGPRLRSAPEVADVAIGVKETKGRIVEPREPCLVVYVHRKGSPHRSKEIEPWHTVSTAEHGRVAFRTDVSDVGVATTGGNLVPSPFVDASEEGSACCVLAADGANYLLSAAHVLDGPNPRLRVNWAKPGLPPGMGDLVTRPGTYWFQERDVTNGLWGAVDAGLVQIREPGLYDNWNLVPWGSGLVALNQVSHVQHVVICGAYSRRIGARFSRWLPTGFPVGEAKTRTHSYWRVALFQFDDPGRATLEGDSGCPVFSWPDERLVGMHLGTYRAPGLLYSMVLSIADILDVYRRLLGGGVHVRLPAPGPS